LIPHRHTLAFIPLLLLSTACSKSEAQPTGPAAPAAAAGMQQFVLKADPGKAMTITEAKQAPAGEKIVVEGRIQKIVKDHAAFTLMAKELPYCGETNKADDCKTPWDYCCEPKETRQAKSLAVEVRGVDGKTVSTPALPDLRLLDLTKVTGQVVKDEHGNLVLVADGLFRVQRPELPVDLRWPQ
jgi:hypothetical protein